MYTSEIVLMIIVFIICLAGHCYCKGYCNRTPGLQTTRLPSGHVEAIYKNNSGLVMLWAWINKCLGFRKRHSEAQSAQSNDTVTEIINPTSDLEPESIKVDTVVVIDEPTSSSPKPKTVPKKRDLREIVPDFKRVRPKKIWCSCSRPLRLSQANFHTCVLIKQLKHIGGFLDDIHMVFYFMDRNGCTSYTHTESTLVPEVEEDIIKRATKINAVWYPDREELLQCAALPVHLVVNQTEMVLRSVVFLPFNTRFGEIVAEYWRPELFTRRDVDMLVVFRNIAMESRHACICRLLLPSEFPRPEDREPSSSRQSDEQERNGEA